MPVFVRIAIMRETPGVSFQNLAIVQKRPFCTPPTDLMRGSARRHGAGNSELFRLRCAKRGVVKFVEKFPQPS